MLVHALGLMSGTSLDGIDLALVDTDGEERVERRAFASVPYDDAFRARLRASLEEAKALSDRRTRPGGLRAVERELTLRHADAIEGFLRTNGLERAAIDIIGFHGQTVLHRPAAGLTVQLGDGPLLARTLQIDVVCDMRAADCAAGGEGAPLAPAYHRALASKAPERPVAFLNVGGVANVTYVGRDGTLIAFDTGPGNALIDDWALRHTGLALDRDGRLAAAGRIDEERLKALLRNAYFGAPPPKSLDRLSFTLDALGTLSPADGAATLTAFTAAAVARAIEHLPEPPRLWAVCGGGRRNRALMTALAERIDAAVAPIEALGLDGDAIEAEAWAYLAVRSLKELPLTFPMTTGVPAPLSGGVLCRR